MSKIPVKYSQKWQKQLKYHNIQTSIVKHVQKDKLHSEDFISQTSIQQTQSVVQGVDKFHQMIKFQLMEILENYKIKNESFFTKKSIKMFLYDILELQNSSIDFIMKQFLFLGNADQNTKIQLDMIIKVIFEVQFISVVNNMIIKEKGIQADSDPSFVHIRKQDLVRLLDQNCFFLKIKPSKQILNQIFNQINEQNGNKNHILVFQYKKFMNSNICQKYNRKTFTPKKVKNTSQKYSSPNKKYQNSIKQVDQQSQMGKSNQNNLSKQSFDHQKLNIHNIQPATYLKKYQYTQGESDSELPSDKQQNQKVQPQQPEQIEQDHQSLYRLQEQSKFGLNSSHKNQQYPQFQEEKLVKKGFSNSKQFVSYLWTKLKRIISEYSDNKSLQISYESSIQIISQLTSNQDSVVYISQGLNKISNNSKNQIKFQKFTSFVLHSLGEMSLKQFSLSQVKGKFQLSQQQLANLLRKAYQNICNRQNEINFQQISSIIFKQKAQNKTNMTYADYMIWLSQKASLCPRI